MARRPHEIQGAVEKAKALLLDSSDAEAVRVAQATLLPLMGLSLNQTAEIVGRNRWWVSRARNRFMRGETAAAHGGRRHALVPAEDELTLVKNAIKAANTHSFSNMTIRAVLRKELDKRSKNTVSESTITELMDRVAPRLVVGARGADLEYFGFHLAWVWHGEDELAARAEKQQRK